MVYSSCGTDCPLTCANYAFRDQIVCIEICRAGCFCTEGQVEHNGRCLDPNDCPENISEFCYWIMVKEHVFINSYRGLAPFTSPRQQVEILEEILPYGSLFLQNLNIAP